MFFFFPVLGIKKNQIEKKNRKKRVDLFEAAVHELQLFARETGGFAEGVQAVGTVARQRHVALLARLAAAWNQSPDDPNGNQTSITTNQSVTSVAANATQNHPKPNLT